MAEAMLMDTEAAVMANFEFLAQADVEMSDEDDIGDDLDLVVGNDVDMRPIKFIKSKAKLGEGKHFDVADDIDPDAEAEEVLNELNMLSENADGNMGENRKDEKDWNQVGESFFYYIFCMNFYIFIFWA